MKKLNKYIQNTPPLWFITIVILLAYLPFLDVRVLRMAGDEKVYISQSIEMARNGTWFAQSLADVPNYFKGPMHYVLTRIGMTFFGNHLISGTWFNAFFSILAAFAMFFLGRKYWNEKAGLLLGVATALNVGIFSHALTSQMEVTLCAFWAFAVVALGLAKQPSLKQRKKKKFSLLKDEFFLSDLPFWLMAGMAGWIKSPAHSFLIGISGITYWAISGKLKARVKSLGSYLAIFAGIAFCLLGYVPILIADGQNFIDSFVLRENINKANNNRAWHYTVFPLLHFLIPWILIVFLGIKKLTRKTLMKNDAALLGLAMALPTILFWAVWTYKGQNYSMPTTCALLLFGFACFKGKIPTLNHKIMAGVGVLALLAGIGLVTRFWPLPEWWTRAWLVVALVSILGYIAIFWFCKNERHISIGAALLFVAFGAAISPLGTRELEDAKPFIKDHPTATFYYYNLEQSIWNEWGLMQFALHQEMKGLHDEAALRKSIKPNSVYFINTGLGLNKLYAYWRLKSDSFKKKHPMKITPWARWLTKGKGPDGRTRWKTAWDNRDLSELERTFYIVRIP